MEGNRHIAFVVKWAFEAGAPLGERHEELAKLVANGPMWPQPRERRIEIVIALAVEAKTSQQHGQGSLLPRGQLCAPGWLRSCQDVEVGPGSFWLVDVIKPANSPQDGVLSLAGSSGREPGISTEPRPTPVGLDAELWADELTPITSRAAPGRVTMQLTRDPFVLSLASDRNGIQVADPVQLYLDCRSAGERALEAAHAIRMDMGW